MNDDWRLQIDLHAEEHAGALIDQLNAHRLQNDLNQAFHERVIVTQEGSRVFAYAGARDQLEQARRLVNAEAAQFGWSVKMILRRWHPLAEEWRAPDEDLPQDAAAKQRERRKLMERERVETAKRGYPEFEVRVSLESWRAAVDLRDRLRMEGIPSVHRWHYLLIGAPDEDSASALADRLRQEVPEATIVVEGTWAAVTASRSSGDFLSLHLPRLADSLVGPRER
jgi:hypothetical protein